jgi:branched-chain amino acid transport system ATP-binding protein
MSLVIHDLQSFYGKSQVLHGVSLDVPPGEITCLLGRNGVGKSTTLKSIMGIVQPRAGSIRLNGTDIARLPPHSIARFGVGYVPEERRIFPTLTVRENLAMGQRSAAAAQVKWTPAQILDYFPSLQKRIASKGAHLSGGEQQMLAIGRALVGNPDVLLVDEPTEGLAPVIVEVVENVIRDIAARGVAVLLVESKLAVAERLATRVFVMSKGEIVFNGSAQQLAENTSIRKQHLEV